jgi:predicted alpha/beta hydrolase
MARLDLILRDLTASADDGYPLSMRLVSAPEPTHAVLVTSGTGFPKGFYERFARHRRLAARRPGGHAHDL